MIARNGSLSIWSPNSLWTWSSYSHWMWSLCSLWIWSTKKPIDFIAMETRDLITRNSKASGCDQHSYSGRDHQKACWYVDRFPLDVIIESLWIWLPCRYNLIARRLWMWSTDSLWIWSQGSHLDVIAKQLMNKINAAYGYDRQGISRQTHSLACISLRSIHRGTNEASSLWIAFSCVI